MIIDNDYDENTKKQQCLFQKSYLKKTFYYLYQNNTS